SKRRSHERPHGQEAKCFLPFLFSPACPYELGQGGGADFMSAIGATTFWIVALALLWLGIAAATAFVAARRFGLGEQVVAAARANATLLELTPARPLVVRADGRIA